MPIALSKANFKQKRKHSEDEDDDEYYSTPDDF